MRSLILVSTALVLLSTLAIAQAGTSVEIGTHLGATFALPDDGDAEVFVSMPGAGASPVIYVAVQPSTSNIIFEPQLYFAWSTVWQQMPEFQTVMQVGYLFAPESKASLYLAAHGGGFFSEDFNSGTIGGGVGVRSRLTAGFALRLEGRYRRWLCEDCDLQDIALLIGFGAILH